MCKMEIKKFSWQLILYILIIGLLLVLCCPKSEAATVKYTEMNVPRISSYCKTWMDYRAITSKSSPQYKLVNNVHNNYTYVDSEGFLRFSAEWQYGIPQDYYIIALGSYYGTEIGTKYRITTDTGNVFYGMLGDQKANQHTNSTCQYAVRNKDIVEFIVDKRQLNRDVRRAGSANVYMPLNGNIAKIEKINFIY